MKPEKLLLIGGLVVALMLVLKSVKQFIYLSFTLLTLKAVWLLLIVIFVLSYAKKFTQSNDSKK